MQLSLRLQGGHAWFRQQVGSMSTPRVCSFSLYWRLATWDILFSQCIIRMQESTWKHEMPPWSSPGPDLPSCPLTFYWPSPTSMAWGKCTPPAPVGRTAMSQGKGHGGKAWRIGKWWSIPISILVSSTSQWGIALGDHSRVPSEAKIMSQWFTLVDWHWLTLVDWHWFSGFDINKAILGNPAFQNALPIYGYTF